METRKKSAASVMRHFSSQKETCHEVSTPKLLLLPGDEYVIAPNGISRTLYNLCSSSQTRQDGMGYMDARGYNNRPQNYHGFSIEEQYNLKAAQKSFIVRDRNLTNTKPNDINRSRYKSICIQEIQDGIQTAGTGSCAWEASILSALYFSDRPALLDGEILELGSGVGLAALLTMNLIAADPLRNAGNLKSLTMSDYVPEVIQQCKENLDRYSDTVNESLREEIKVCHMDWYDSFDLDSNELKYDTIIGSDIVYRREDIIPLLTTISRRLQKNSDNANSIHSPTAHLFGPNNRAILHDLVQETKSKWKASLDISTEIITMDRSRLEPSTDLCVSTKSSLYLHVRISHKSQNSLHGNCQHDESASFADID